MVNHLARRNRPIVRLIDNVGAQPPDVGLFDLNKGTSVITSRPSPNTHRTDRYPIVRYLPGLELRGWGKSSALGWPVVKVAGAHGSTSIRAIVNGASFSGFPVKRCTAYWAGYGRDLGRWRPGCPTIQLPAFTRTEQKPRAIASNPIRLDFDAVFAPTTRNKHTSHYRRHDVVGSAVNPADHIGGILILRDLMGDEALDRVLARLAGEPHSHHKDCIHNLPADEQIALRGRTREWWEAMELPEPVVIDPSQWGETA